MKKLNYLTLGLLTLSCPGPALQAGPMITLDPAGGSVFAPAGEAAGWGFTITGDDTNWISITSSFLINETGPSLGFYLDFIGSNGGPVDAAIPPGTSWTEVFDASGFTGTGAFFIDPSAQPGQVDSATLIVLYDTFSGDPAQCVDCLVSQDAFAIPVSIQPTPEPGAVLLCAGGLLILAGRRIRRAPRLPHRAAVPQAGRPGKAG